MSPLFSKINPARISSINYAPYVYSTRIRREYFLIVFRRTILFLENDAISKNKMIYFVFYSSPSVSAPFAQRVINSCIFYTILSLVFLQKILKVEITSCDSNIAAHGVQFTVKGSERWLFYRFLDIISTCEWVYKINDVYINYIICYRYMCDLFPSRN